MVIGVSILRYYDNFTVTNFKIVINNQTETYFVFFWSQMISISGHQLFPLSNGNDLVLVSVEMMQTCRHFLQVEDLFYDLSIDILNVDIHTLTLVQNGDFAVHLLKNNIIYGSVSESHVTIMIVSSSKISHIILILVHCVTQVHKYFLCFIFFS